MLKCAHVSDFWIKVTAFMHSMFQIHIPVDEKVLFIGYQIHDRKFTLANLIIVFTQYAIYTSYIMYKMQRKSFHVLSIWHEFKKEILCYINWQFKHNTNVLDNFHRMILQWHTCTLQIRCVKLCKVVYYMNHTTQLCGSYSTQLYTTFYTAYTTDLQCNTLIIFKWNISDLYTFMNIYVYCYC